MQSSKVHPSDGIPEQTIKLSLCDAYAPKVWVTQTHFWPLPRDSQFDTSTTALRSYHVLREALSRTISEIPVLSGTVVQQTDDARDLAIRIDRDAHVNFALDQLAGYSDIPSYADLKATGFPIPPSLVQRFSQPVMLEPVYEGSPTLTAKLNVLDGGLALTVAVNHLIADAAAVNELEKIWSKHAMDVSNNRQGRHRVETPEASHRVRLSSPIANAMAFNNPAWEVFPADQSQLGLPKRSLPTALENFKEESSGTSEETKEPTHWCLWRFDAPELAQLKQNATKANAEQWVSTLDAVVGLFWSRLSVVKASQTESADDSKIFMSINIRHRLEESLHSQYFGNAVDMVTAKLPIKQLQSAKTSLSEATYCVRSAINAWSEPEWAAWLTAAVNIDIGKAICPSPGALLASQNLGVTDASKIETHLIDWGPELGHIERTRYMMSASGLAGYATLLTVYPRLKDGGLEVGTILTPSLKDALMRDAVFSQYAKSVCTY